MGFLKNIELPEMYDNAVIKKFDLKDGVIKRGSTLTVREGQNAVFCDKGRTADVFEPGMYKLDTDSLPVITRLLSWEFGFETPYKSDIYFVNVREFTGIRWGTSNPVPVQTELGIIRVRGYGSYSFKISDPAAFLTNVSGAVDWYPQSKICETLRSMIVGNLSSAMGNLKISLSDMTSRYGELGQAVLGAVKDRCAELGITLTAFDVENLSVPPEVEKAVDENAKLGILRDNVDVYSRLAQADALKEAARHGAAGTVMGFGVGMKLSGDINGATGRVCANCKTQITAGAKFCPECGTPVKKFCPECGAPITPEAKFCAECGNKI